MGYIEEKEAELKHKIIPQCAKEDFWEFWQNQVAEMRKVPLKIERKRLPGPYDRYFLTDEITFNTHDNTMVKAWFTYPVNKAKEKLPCVAQFHGGGGRRARHLETLATGVCEFAIDVRSQGGATPDQASYEIDYRGKIATRGALSPDNYYLKNVYLDAIRAMDVIVTLPEVDTKKIVTSGISQGGALSIVTSALSGHSSQCFAACPSYNCLKQRVENGTGIFADTKAFLTNDPQYTDQVMDTLSYFDVNNMVSYVEVPTTVHLGMVDPICLPHFVYSVWTHAKNKKKLWMSPFTAHVQSRDYILYRHGEFAKLLDD
jgi:cephalosporin-C deacetylase